MEKEGCFVETKEMIEEYVEDRILLLKLQLTEKTAKLSSALFIALAVGFLVLILVMIVSFVAGYYLSQAVGSYWGGFGILAAFYIILILLLLYAHKRFLSSYIIDRVVKNSFEVKKTSENGV